MTQNFQIIRECLETTYTHVTFVKSVSHAGENGLTESITTYWTVGENFIPILITYDADGEVNVTNEKCYVYGFGMSGYVGSKLFTKTKNEKVENKMEKLAGIELNVLRNGVRVLENGIKNDLEATQAILNINQYARDVDAETAYAERDYTQHENTYEVMIQRSKEYKEFSNMLHAQKCDEVKGSELVKKYHADEIEYKEYRDARMALMRCECGKCKAKRPTLEEWKTGIIEFEEWNEFTKTNRTKQMKVGKYLLKQGFPQEIIDFYSAQVKTEKTAYLTITSAPQFIAGMSYYAEPNSWDGYNGTSCMDVRHGGSYSKKLGGALADNMLHVAFLHNELEDLQDMENKMLARVVMRPVEVEGEWALIPTRYYGNNVTKDLMHYALNQLNELLVYSTDITTGVEDDDDVEELTESIDGGYEMCVTEQANAYENDWVTVSCSCPACGGEGNIEREVEVNDRYVEVSFECPMCEGSGEYETEVHVEYDEYIDVETEETVYCYYENEGSHYEFDEYNECYTLDINTSQVKRDIAEYIG